MMTMSHVLITLAFLSAFSTADSQGTIRASLIKPLNASSNPILAAVQNLTRTTGPVVSAIKNAFNTTSSKLTAGLTTTTPLTATLAKDLAALGVCPISPLSKVCAGKSREQGHA